MTVRRVKKRTKQVNSEAYNKTRFTTRVESNRNLLRLTSFPQGRTEQCFEPDFAPKVAEQVDSDEYQRKESHFL